MTEKISIPVLSNDQKQDLYKKVMEEDLLSHLPEVNKSYRWVLKVSKEVFNVFELELQKHHFLTWRRTTSFYISLDALKKYDSVETCLKNCSETLLEMEEDKLNKVSPKVSWIVDED